MTPLVPSPAPRQVLTALVAGKQGLPLCQREGPVFSGHLALFPSLPWYPNLTILGSPSILLDGRRYGLQCLVTCSAWAGDIEAGRRPWSFQRLVEKGVVMM